MATEKEDVIITNRSGNDIHIFNKVDEFVKYQENYNTGFNLTNKEAEILLEYMREHDYVLGLKKGVLYRGDLAEGADIIKWEVYSMDDVIDIVCEWNYELILDDEADFISSGKEVRSENELVRYNKLKSEEKVLDELFDKTKYAKVIEEFAEKLAHDFIAKINDKENNFDVTIDKFASECAEKIKNYSGSERKR